MLGAYKMALHKYPQNVNDWENYSGSAKIVVAVNSEDEIIKLQEKAKELDLPYNMVRDAGRTEVTAGTITALAVGPGKKSIVDKVTGSLELL